MAHIVADRVLETSTTTGAGALTLSGAVNGFRTFSAVCAVGDTVEYAIQMVDGVGTPTGEWETGLGTYSAANTLTRTTVVASSNSNAAVGFAAGNKRVMIASLARTAKHLTLNPSNDLVIGDPTANHNTTKFVRGSAEQARFETNGTLTLNGGLMVGAGITGAGNYLTLASPGIGYGNGFTFTRNSDGAGINVIEPSNDRVLYEFWLHDNVEGQDAFQWRHTDYKSPNGLFVPLMINDQSLRVIGKAANFYAPLAQPQTNGFYTTSDPNGVNGLQYLQAINDATKLKISGTGSATISAVNVAGYTGTDGALITIVVEAGGATFSWRQGGPADTAVQSGLAISTSPVALSNGITVTFSATTGFAANDIFGFRAYKPISNTLGKTHFNDKVGVLATVPTEAGIGIRLGDTVSEGVRFGAYGALLSPDTHVAHNLYYTGSAWAQFDGARSSSTIRLCSGTSNDIDIGFAAAGSNTITYPFKFTSAGTFSTATMASTVATGTAPLTVTSTTLVSNLNADYLDGQHGSYYAPIASPALTGTPTAPTATTGTNTTQLATTAFVKASIDASATGITTTTFTATSGQTVFTTPSAFTNCEVYRNGVKLVATTHYTAASPSITLTTGAVTGDTVEVVAYNAVTLVQNGFEVGFRAVPQNAQNAAYTLALSDGAKHIYKSGSTAYALTIPPHASVAFDSGTAVTIVNDNALGDITITRGSGVALVMAGSTTDANRTLAAGGMATLLKVGTNRWMVSGTGLT